MQTGKSYKLFEFLDWTRRDIYVLIVLGVVPAVAYQAGNMKWLGIPWTVVALLGTATAFIVGFKNVQSYNRTWEARHIWGDIISNSRAWGAMSRRPAPRLCSSQEVRIGLGARSRVHCSNSVGDTLPRELWGRTAL